MGSSFLSTIDTNCPGRYHFAHTINSTAWTSLDFTLRDRYGSGCGIVRSKYGRYLVATGGRDLEARIGSELLDLDTLECIRGNELPHMMTDSSGVQWGGTVGLLGGTRYKEEVIDLYLVLCSRSTF